LAPEIIASDSPNPDVPLRSLIGERLTPAVFAHLSGTLAGIPFIKLVFDKAKGTIHFINNSLYQLHVRYIGDVILGVGAAELEGDIDSFNKSVYFDKDRRFYLGILALHTRNDRQFFSLETVEVDTMDAEMIRFFHASVQAMVDPSLPVFFKPANHLQEQTVTAIDPVELPRVLSHELFASSSFIALNHGTARGRLRVFTSLDEYRDARATLEWHDILVMPRVPDDIPRVSGIINAEHTTPLSHTNVLAAGWQIPNAIQLGVVEQINKDALNGEWVEYTVQPQGGRISLKKIAKPIADGERPAWLAQKIKLEEPETAHTPIMPLGELRMTDRHRYGTKAANLGELTAILEEGSDRLTGFYGVRRPPRANLLPYLSRFLEEAPTADAPTLGRAGSRFLRDFVRIPRGVAIPFAVQQEFLAASPKIQQGIGRLKMALELNARQVDSLCVSLQQMIRAARFPEPLRRRIDSDIARHLSGVSSFVVRSSSNAEDLEGFSAAGIYESINHVTTADNLFESIKTVWASLLTPRSVRLRQEVGISLDDTYMGVIVQEEVPAAMGGVLVTTNPLNKNDFRNVYFNISPRVTDVVSGASEPLQYLYNTVEGGGRTLSLGAAAADLAGETKLKLQKLAFAGRLLQSHFSPDYTFSAPVDIEWLLNDEGMYVLQLRPFAK
jgi:hypothetical protein